MIYQDGQTIVHQLVLSGYGNELIRFLKKTKYISFLNESSYNLNRLTAIIVAALTAIGISYTYSYTPDGTLTLVFSNVTFEGITNALFQFSFSYMSQQGFYQFTKEKDNEVVNFK